MFIKNYTNADLQFNAKGERITLKTGQSTPIPDGVTTLEELQTMFGKTAVGIDTSGTVEAKMSNQQVISAGKLYATDSCVGEMVRLFVGLDGTVDVYGSDSKTIPTAFTNMSCPEENEDVTGVLSFGLIPRYLAIKAHTGTPELIITNCTLMEVGSIA